MSIAAMMKDKARMIPKKGFNLVGLDDFEEAGEQLYIIGNFPSKAEAEKKMKELSKKNSDKMFIYGPDDH